MTTFNKYFNKSEEEVNESKKDLTLKKIVRGFESALDQLEEAKMELQENLEKERARVANGEVSRIQELSLLLNDIKETDVVIDQLKQEASDFTSEKK